MYSNIIRTSSAPTTASPSDYELGPDGHFYRTFNQCDAVRLQVARAICESTSGAVVLHVKSDSTQQFIDGLRFLPSQWVRKAWGKGETRY